MGLPRRKFLHLAASAVTLPSLCRVASADDYPTRPVRIIAGFAAGGASVLHSGRAEHSAESRLAAQGKPWPAP